MVTTFEKSLKLTNLTLFFSGIRIFPSQNQFLISFLNYLFYFNLIWLYTDVFGEFFWLVDGIQVGKSFSELSLIAPCTTICLLSTAKSVPIFHYRNVVLNVVEKLKQIHLEFEDTAQDKDNIDKNKKEEKFQSAQKEFKKLHENEREDVERKIVKESMWFLKFVIMLLYYSSILVIIAFTTLPVLVMAYEYYTTGQTELKLPFLTKYFFNPFTKIMWPIVYIHQVWSTLIAAANVFGADTFLYAFCTYCYMHFGILCHRFEHVVCDSLVETKAKFRVLVLRHQELIELVNQIEMVYSKSTLCNIITSSVLICLSAFNVTFLDDGAAVFAFFAFLMMSLSQISLLCLFGDLLMSSSTKITEGVYKCRWYDTDASFKRSVMLILIRAQKPCRLTAANFADLNLTAFTTILSRSWSYFALLRTVYK